MAALQSLALAKGRGPAVEGFEKKKRVSRKKIDTNAQALESLGWRVGGVVGVVGVDGVVGVVRVPESGTGQAGGDKGDVRGCWSGEECPGGRGRRVGEWLGGVGGSLRG